MGKQNWKSGTVAEGQQVPTEVTPEGLPEGAATETMKLAEQMQEKVVTPTPDIKPATEPVITPSDYKYNPFWDFLSSQGLEVPEKVKTGKYDEGEDENSILMNTILNNVEIEHDDPIIADYYARKNEETFNPKEYFKSLNERFSYDEMSNDALVAKSLKERNETEKRGWTDDDIKNYVEKLPKIELDMQADAIRDQYKKNIETTYKENANKLRSQNQPDPAKVEKEFNDRISGVISKTENINDIWGVKVDKVSLDNFRKNFKEYFIPGKDGQRPLDKILTDDVNLFRFLMLADKDGAILKSALTNAKEETKASIERRLGLSSEIETSGVPRMEGLAGPDWGAGKEPE